MSKKRFRSSSSSFVGRVTGPSTQHIRRDTRGLYHKGKSIYLNTRQGRKMVGTIIENQDELILVKNVKVKKHLHRCLNAWGIDSELLKALSEMGVSIIRIVTDEGITEEAELDTYFKSGITKDYGCGLQVFLPRAFFRSHCFGQGDLFGGVS